MSANQLTPAEQQLKQRLQQWAEQETADKPLSWEAGWLPARRQPSPWRWLAPGAVAAAIGWFWLVPGTAPDPAQPPMLLADNYQLDAIDKELQQAYLISADQQHIDSLWQQRKTAAMDSPQEYEL
ncbi:hypothetical protein IDSA_05330 [Pseudidiomarina salinarum]|uniref:Uncharacterized protein n=1 Tax=Pseudidiomarina salinarum TaxID=435908 RepID=A0A094J206_9GAMM|nr:hypothetical protein [Pseudidiomarina salinarum]KFZ32094.1 hypothetical protein IDSA_05330 [Pseudidiomarina salinarum]RUO70126.1 hypothetical protein CWI79_01255 [Pseudidiomarina salinarum]